MEPVVYLIDDDEDFRTAMSRALRIHGYKVESHSSAEEFLEASIEPFSCMVLDVKMSGMNGFQLQQILSSRPFSPPIIFLTGHADVPSTVNAMKLGAVDLLTKPVRTQGLISAVESALRSNREKAEAEQRSQQLTEKLESLTPREREVFNLVIRGRLNKQIAHELGTTERTIKAHRQKVMSKMDALTIQNLMNIAGELGLLSWELNDA